MKTAIAARRLQNQLITRTGLRRPADVVAWFGAVQAQEFDAAKWALGLRMRGGTVDAGIQRAFDAGRILRTHVMRPTWHFVTPSDIRWLLELTAPRVHRVMATYNRQLELDQRTLTRGTGVIERALGDGRHMTRAELGARLHRVGLPMAGPRLAHLMMHAELEGVICSGPRRGRRMTYALLEERAPDAQRLSHDEALATLGSRFFRSHGPATIRDFVWWSGLATADAKRAVDMIGARREDVGERTYWSIGQPPDGARRNHPVQLLPIYDEYLVAYRNREAVPHGPATIRWEARGPVTFQHPLVIGGQVAGTWRATRDAQGILIRAIFLQRLDAMAQGALAAAVRRYQRFVAAPVDLSVE